MADKWNDNIPSITNSVTGDVADIKENLEFAKDILQTITGGWSNTATTHFMVGNAGDFNRSKIVSASDTTITLTAAKYHHAGTTDQMVYWADTGAGITFTVGSGGSNSSSDDLGADEWHYIFLDDSAIVTAGTNIISNTELVNDTTAPTWNGAKYGWYGGQSANDRCIGAFYSDADSDILEMFHDGGDYVCFADAQADKAATDIDTTWTDVTLTIPGVCTKAFVTFEMDYTSTGSEGFWRTNGQTGSTGHEYGRIGTGCTVMVSSHVVLTDTSQIIEIKHADSNDATSAVRTSGFYLPQGM